MRGFVGERSFAALSLWHAWRGSLTRLALMSNLLRLRHGARRLGCLTGLLLLLLSQKRRVLVRAGRSTHTVRDAWLSVRKGDSCRTSRSRIHCRLALLHHGPSKMLCC